MHIITYIYTIELFYAVCNTSLIALAEVSEPVNCVSPPERSKSTLRLFFFFFSTLTSKLQFHH